MATLVDAHVLYGKIVPWRQVCNWQAGLSFNVSIPVAKNLKSFEKIYVKESVFIKQFRNDSLITFMNFFLYWCGANFTSHKNATRNNRLRYDMLISAIFHGCEMDQLSLWNGDQ